MGFRMGTPMQAQGGGFGGMNPALAQIMQRMQQNAGQGQGGLMPNAAPPMVNMQEGGPMPNAAPPMVNMQEAAAQQQGGFGPAGLLARLHPGYTQGGGMAQAGAVPNGGGFGPAAWGLMSRFRR
jgi:hypothetical protein